MADGQEKNTSTTNKEKENDCKWTKQILLNIEQLKKQNIGI